LRRATKHSRAAAPVPSLPTTLGIVAMRKSGFPGSSRSGEKPIPHQPRALLCRPCKLPILPGKLFLQQRPPAQPEIQIFGQGVGANGTEPKS